MKLSFIIPSRLARNPGDANGGLFLERCVARIRLQKGLKGHAHEIVVGLDAGTEGRAPKIWPEVKYSESTAPGQAGAVNSAVAAATGEVLIFVEDDDYPVPNRLTVQLPMLERGYDLITSNALEQDVQGNFLKINDFPTPSGWLMRRSLWEELGGMCQDMKWHIDNEFLGRVIAAKKKRLHIVEREALASIKAAAKQGVQTAKNRAHLLSLVGRFSDLGESPLPHPLVCRTANPAGGMSTIATVPAEKAHSVEENRKMAERWGFWPT